MELEAYLKDFPKDPFHEHAIPYLGDTQLRLNDPAAALTTFQQAIERYPQGALVDDAKFGRARALEGLKRDDEAAEQFRALAANKESLHAADAQFHVGSLAFDTKKFPEAAAAYVELTKSFPNSRFLPAAHLNAGYAYYQSGKFAEAATQFEAAAADNSQRVVAGYWQGLSLKSQTQYAKAAEVLKATAAAAGEQPLAHSIVYQQAVCERNQGRIAEAKQLFETVLARWPSGEFADDSLHAMTEMSVETGDLATADVLLVRFAREFPESNLKSSSDLLAGRMELSRAAADLLAQKPANEVEAHYDVAATRFENVMQNSTIPASKGQARYYLAFTRQLQGQHAKALEVIAPLIDEVRAQGAKSDLIDALVLQADSLQAEKKYEDSEKAVAAYLEFAPRGNQAPRALAILAVAATRRGDQAKSDAALERLNREFPDHPLRAVTTQQLAELADAREDWTTAARLYEALIPLSKNPDLQPFSIRGLAWAQLRQKQPALAAKTFARIAQEFPSHRLALECGYYRAEALRDAGEFDASVAAFDELLRKIPADKPAEAGAEQQAPGLYSFRAGQQAARMSYKAKHIKQADAEFEELVLRFPRQQRLDQTLNEWALINYNAQNFERADEIFRRLVRETPDSEFADNARLSLAESDLLAERLEPARKEFEDLVASDKSDAEVKERALYQLLVLAVDQQRWKDVRQLAGRMTTDFPDSPQRLYATYSVCEAILADPKSSDQELDGTRDSLNGLRKLQDNPDVRSLVWFDRVWVLLAEVAFRRMKYEELDSVVSDLRQRPVKSPYLYQAEEVLGRGYKLQEPPKYDDAIKAFERVVTDPSGEKTETAAKCQFLIGETYFLQEKWADAFLAYQKVYSNYAFPEWQSAALFQSAKCDEQQQQWKEAAGTYRLLIDKFPRSIQIKDARTRLEAAIKKLDK